MQKFAMKFLLPVFLTLLVAVTGEPPASKRSLVYSHWPPKNSKQNSSPKTNTLMVQIRSDHPVPIVFKGRPGQTHTHGQFMQLPQTSSYSHSHHGGFQRRPRPIKYSSPIYLKPGPMKPLRQQLKIKLTNSGKLHSKPIAANYEKPYKYEKPSTVSYVQVDLPSTTKANFISEHFAPIHTIPAPNLALHDNHIQHEEPQNSSPKPQSYHQSLSTTYKNTNNNNNKNHLEHQYQVLEDITNDVTFIDPISESQKLFAPDPDPSLPTSKVRPATEPYNTPSNAKPYPSDVQSNNLQSVQILGTQHAKLTANDVFPLQYTVQQNVPQLQPFISQHLTAIQTAPISNYDPTYLVTQSNNLYSQHKQQLFQPQSSPAQIIEPGYVNADLTQEVASDGQIFQAGKHSQASESLPQFAALIAAPALEQAQTAAISPFRLPNVAAPDPQGGFVISNYYNNAVQDSSQLLDAYAEEEAQAEAELQNLQQHQQQLQLQEQQRQQLELQEQQQQQLLLQEQQRQQLQLQEQQQRQLQHRQQQHQLHLQEKQQQPQQFLHLQQIQEAAKVQNQFQSQQLLQEQTPKHIDTAASAFEEHQRLVQHQLGGNTPLRIFVPDDDGSRLQKRAEKRSDEINASQADNEESQ